MNIVSLFVCGLAESLACYRDITVVHLYNTRSYLYVFWTSRAPVRHRMAQCSLIPWKFQLLRSLLQVFGGNSIAQGILLIFYWRENFEGDDNLTDYWIVRLVLVGRKEFLAQRRGNRFTKRPPPRSITAENRRGLPWASGYQPQRPYLQFEREVDLW